MSSGQEVRAQIQYALESPKGTAAAALGFILGAEHKALSPDHQTHKIKDATGTRSVGVRNMSYVQQVEDTLAIKNAYFQAFPILGSIALVGGVTAVEQTVGEGDYLWDFTPVLNTENDPDSIALWLGDNIAAKVRHYVMCKRLRISFNIPQGQGEANVSATAEYFAQQNATGNFATGLSPVAAKTINAKLARFYEDSAWAGLGTTELAGILRGGDIEILTGLHPTMNGSANTYFEDHEESVLDISMALRVERNSVSQALRSSAAFTSPKTTKAVRLQFNGPQIGAGDNHSLIIDANGYWDQYVEAANSVNGTFVDTVTFVGQEDSSAAKLLALLVTTDISSI